MSDFAQILHTKFTSMREANFRKIGQVFFVLQPSQKYKFDPENHG